MRTVRTKVYSFNELTENAQQKAINTIRNKGIDVNYVYDDAYETVKKFHYFFNTNEGSRSWFDVSFNKIDDNVLKLEGLRLRTYLLNNFYCILYQRKYITTINKWLKVRHNMCFPKQGKITPEYTNIYSNLSKTTDCVLTGVCYDNDLLQPIYDFIDNYKGKLYQSCMTFEELINDCFASLEKSIENEIDYRNSDEAIIETILSNGYEFTKDGDIFNQ